ILTAATHKDNPGENIYFYVGNKSSATIGKDTYTRPWNGPLTITQTNGNVYKGGTYAYSRAVNTQLSGTSYRYTRVNLYDRNGKSPVAVPSTGSFTSGSANLTVVYGNGNPVNDSPIAQQNWNSAGGEIPGKVQQTIWYVNADTGEVMAHKSSEKLIAGQTYDVTDSGPTKVLYGNKVYTKVERSADGYDESKLSQAVLDSVLTTNSGVKITVGDILNTPLKGTIGSERKGNINIGTTDYGPSRLYISQQIDDGGTVTLNTYDIQPSDVVPGAMSATLVQAGNITTQSLPSVYTAGTGDAKLDAAAATAQGDMSAFFNGRRPGNQDVVFLYRAISNPQNANITFVNDDTGASLSTQQDASGDA
ncbi:MAG: hypothetical protein K2O64_02310, partial [Lactobacillus sp.]|nr:hypothetical protein [Lactobacillus sp.]